MKTAEDLLNYNKSEEAAIEKIIKDIADAGVKVVVSGSSISEMALHFIERYQMMVVKTPSKFELRRIAKAVRATPLVKLVLSTSCCAECPSNDPHPKKLAMLTLLLWKRSEAQR